MATESMATKHTCLSRKAWLIAYIGLLLLLYTLMSGCKTHTSRLEENDAMTSCQEHMHVVYVRTPGMGSSSMTRLLLRYGMENNLTFLLSNVSAEHKSSLLEPNAFHLPTEGKFCDMMANIVQFNYEDYRPYFPPDVAFVTMLRDPLHRLNSTIYQFDYFKNKMISVQKKVDNFQEYPDTYDLGFRRSLTHNPVSEILGLPRKDMTNIRKVSEFIFNIEKRFAFVLIIELFDESLLFLRNRLCWPMKNILYKWRNTNRAINEIQYSKVPEQNMRKWSSADYRLYEYFKNKLLAAIKEAGNGFQEELANFRSVLSRTEQFCNVGISNNLNTRLLFPQTRFYEEFFISEKFCILRNAGEPELFKSIYSEHEQYNFCDGWDNSF